MELGQIFAHGLDENVKKLVIGQLMQQIDCYKFNIICMHNIIEDI